MGTSLAGCVSSEHIYHLPHAFLENISPGVKPKKLHLGEAEHGVLTPLFSPQDLLLPAHQQSYVAPLKYNEMIFTAQEQWDSLQEMKQYS